MTERFPKPKYEPPIVIDLGSMAKGIGALDCTPGYTATRDCTQGDTAQNNCSAGTAALVACSAGVSALSACSAGTGLTG